MYKGLVAIVSSVLVIASPMVATLSQAEPASLTQLFPALEGIQLTPEQQAQLTALNSQTLTQIQSVLTSEQQSQFNVALSENNGMKDAISSINLSFAQRRQLRNQLQDTRSQLTQILTQEQQRELSDNEQTLQNQDG